MPKKCIICPADVVDNDLCNTCQDFKDNLIVAATGNRRALITGTLTQYGFNIVDTEDDRECPVKCGHCCRTSWATVLSLRYKFGEEEGKGSPCPHLKDDGCELTRDKRPNGCVSFLCSLAWHVLADRLSAVSARQLLEKHNGDSTVACARLDERELTEGS